MSSLNIRKSLLSRLFRHIVLPIRISKRIVKRILFLRTAKRISYEIWTKYLHDTNFKKYVYIVQDSFYDNEGQRFFAGGGERYAVDLSRLIARAGYQPILFQKGKKNVWVRENQGLRIVGLPVPDSREIGDILKCLPSPALTIYAGTSYFGNLLHPNVRISHGITWDVPNRNVTKPARILNRLLKDVDIFVSVDTNTISWLRCTLAWTMSRITQRLIYIPNYCDPQRFRLTPRPETCRLRIVFPRRCSKERGYWLVSSILSDLLKEYPQVDFMFIGTPCQKEIERDIERIHSMYPERISHRIVDPDKMHEVYQKSDIAIIPTLYSEGTSLSCIEAMACGNAVIASNVGGLTNLIIQGYNGILINPTTDELKDSLKRLIENEELRITLSRRAAETSVVFHKDKWEAQWNGILKKHLL